MGLYGDSGQHIYERKMTKTFEQLGVSEPLRRAIEENGVLKPPMPVQEMVIPHLLNEDGDVVALAQTGTGKTAAFGLPGAAAHRHSRQRSAGAHNSAYTRTVSADQQRSGRLLQIHALPLRCSRCMEGQV